MSKLYRISDRLEQSQITDFLELAERKLSSYEGHTLTAFACRWRVFKTWYTEEGNNRSLLNFTSLDADDFFRWFRIRKGFGKRLHRDLKVSDSTCKDYAQTYSLLWDAVFSHKRIVAPNPWEPARQKYARSKESQRRKTNLTPGDVFNMIEAPSPDTIIGLRDRAMLAAMYGGALRRGEVASLKICDVTMHENRLVLRLIATKSKKDTLQPINAKYAKYIIEYLEKRKQHAENPSEPFFISYLGCYCKPIKRHLTGQGVYDIFKSWAAKTGLPDDISPHSARLTPITKLLDKGLPHRRVAIFSRHASITMVERYDAERKNQKLNPFDEID